MQVNKANVYRYLIGVAIGLLINTIMCAYQMNKQLDIELELRYRTALTFFYYGCATNNGFECMEITRKAAPEIERVIKSK